MKYCYEYPRAMLTTDVILISENETSTEILLIERKFDPYQNCWALPGGFIEMDENIETAARRELFEETNIEIDKLIQFRTYGDLNRDPRGRVVSVIYYAFVDSKLITPKAGDDAKNAKWFDIKSLPDLAFDHNQIINDAITTILNNE